MSDRILTLTAAIKDFAARCRARGITDPDVIAETVFKNLHERGLVSNRNANAVWLDYIKRWSVFRVNRGNKGDDRQMHLWENCEAQVYNLQFDGGVIQKVLADFDLADIEQETAQKQDNIEAAAAELRLWNRAKRYVVPLLDAHPDWKWRNAVEHMRTNGGLPSLED
jgi:hypothetical protein